MRAWTVEELIEERKRRWGKYRSIKKDSEFCEASVQYVLGNAGERRRLVEKPYLLIELCMQVVNKKKRTVPFVLNRVQRDFLDHFAGRTDGRPFFVLKGRQQGFTTLITALQLSYCLLRKNFAGFTLADCQANANAIFLDKAKSLYAHLPPSLRAKTKYNSKQELIFEKLGSSWRVDAAGEHLGRSRTLHFVHYSEVAFYRCGLEVLQRGLGEAMTEDAVQIYESTANGYNSAKQLWDSGACVNLFYPWWLSEEYRSKEGLPEVMDGWLAERIAYLRDLGLEEEQLSWYARKYQRYLDKESIRQEYPCTPEEAFVMSGGCVFEREILLRRLAEVEKPICRGRFVGKRHREGDSEWLSDGEFVEDEEGYVVIHKEPETRVSREGVELHPYVIGADTAGEGSDYYAAKVVSVVTGESVATLHVQNIDDDLFAEQLYWLGKKYHDALLAVEVNYSVQPQRLLYRWGYAPLFRRERTDGVGGGVTRKLGFCTTSVTRPLILSGLKRAQRENPNMENHPETLREMLSFVKNADGRWEAASGCHDDLVMALAIAHYAREGADCEWKKQEVEEEDWIAEHFHVT
ncbi:MAG: hypothetical protein IJX70_04595 [Clostridia bacterium]|nr:hypothetical protein [Clostridia bacterium]